MLLNFLLACLNHHRGEAACGKFNSIEEYNRIDCGEGTISEHSKKLCFVWKDTCDTDVWHGKKRVRVTWIAENWSYSSESGAFKQGPSNKDEQEYPILYMGKWLAGGVFGSVYNAWARKEDTSQFELVGVVKVFDKNVSFPNKLFEKLEYKRETDQKKINKMNKVKTAAQTIGKGRFVTDDWTKDRDSPKYEEVTLMERYGYPIRDILWGTKPRGIPKANPLLGCIYLYEIVVDGLQPVHNKGRAHRDLHTGNVLTAVLSQDMESLTHIFTMADFGSLAKPWNGWFKTAPFTGDMILALYAAVRLTVGYADIWETEDRQSSMCKISVPQDDPVWQDADERQKLREMEAFCKTLVGTLPGWTDVPKFTSVNIREMHEKWETLIKDEIVRLTDGAPLDVTLSAENKAKLWGAFATEWKKHHTDGRNYLDVGSTTQKGFCRPKK